MADPDSALIPETRRKAYVPRQHTAQQSAITVGATGDSGTRHENAHHRAHSASSKTAAKGVDGGIRLFPQSNRLFITDRDRTLRLLIDTGYDVCVAPRRIAPGRRGASASIFSLSTVHTYQPTGGTRSLNLGIRRDITWRAVVPHVQLPIFGTECRNRLLDEVTSLSTSAQTPPIRFPSLKTIGIDTPENSPKFQISRTPRKSRGKCAITRYTTSKRHLAHQCPVDPVGSHRIDSREPIPNST